MSPQGLASLALALLAGCAGAPPASPGPAPERSGPEALGPKAQAPGRTESPGPAPDALFAPLVAADRDWELTDGDGATIAVELRRYEVGDVTIARLRWSYRPKDGPVRTDIGSVPVVIAVGPDGVDLHETADDLDDDAVVTLLDDGADMQDPPAQREAGTSYRGRVLQTERGPITCFGLEPPDDQSFECPDICYAQLCWSAKDGPVRLNGRWAPDDHHFYQPGYESFPDAGQPAPAATDPSD